MNPDNPYAAPQTLETLASTALALAEERSDPFVRVLFPEIDTPALARIEAASRAIRRMTIGWTLLLALFIIGLVTTTMSGGELGKLLLLIVGVVALMFRIYAGIERVQSLRYYSLLVDLTPCLLLLFFVCRELIQSLPVSPLPVDVPLISLTFFVFLYMPVTSVLAHSRYGRLFGDGRIHHDDLARELAHRRQYRIP